ncbi:MAG: hypothetical protein LBU83_07055 [Bacteroidales bacterium]|jgi:hypothetical protein|nr:hypothetical protein [Bacteroidales bacterium]
MIKRKSILNIFIYLLAFIGTLSIILLIIGYRPVNTTTEPDWTAISSIATILAVITALFITKWQDLINNKKSLKIQWFHVERQPTARLQYSEFLENRRIDEFCINLINTGNRKIIIEGVYILFSNKTRNPLFPYQNDTSEITFPCVLEPEMAASYHIPFLPMIQAFKIFIQGGHVKDNDNLIIEVHDTTDKVYIYNTKIKIFSYIQNYKILVY